MGETQAQGMGWARHYSVHLGRDVSGRKNGERGGTNRLLLYWNVAVYERKGLWEGKHCWELRLEAYQSMAY